MQSSIISGATKLCTNLSLPESWRSPHSQIATLCLKNNNVPLAYSPMRAFAFSLIALLAIVDAAWSQGIAAPSGRVSATPSARAAELPMYRPVLLGQGPNALINRIDEQDLIRKGQKDALIMFMCAVRKDGGVEWGETYRG